MTAATQLAGGPGVVAAPLLVALVTAITCLLVRPWPGFQRGVSLLGSVAYLVAAAALGVATTTAGRPLTYQVSAWPAPFGITLVGDALSALLLGLTAVVSLVSVVYALEYLRVEDQRLTYHPLYHFMVLGVTGSFLTGDLFNLFVWFEVMLISSYVLVVYFGGPQQTRAALTYAVLNLVGGALMLVAVGGIYSTTGTLNMADLAHRLGAASQYGIDTGAVLGLSAVLFGVFALKAGAVPFQFWVPDAYRAAPAPVAAMLAGVVKKVGVYVIIRLYFTVFQPAGFLEFYAPVLLVVAAASILFGGLGAAGRPDLDGLFAYSSISQLGFILLPLAVAAATTDPTVRALGVTAALVYAVNHGLAKSLLFLASGVVYQTTGTRQLDQLGGLTERLPLLSAAVFVGSLGLIGIPPLTGFFAKFLVFDAAIRGASTVALGLALLGAVLTITYLSRTWLAVFWGPPVDLEVDARAVTQMAVVALAVAIVVLGVGFDPLLQAARAAATAAATDAGRQAYVDAVLSGVVG